ncbi:hypothetical protein WICPIJ_007265 [Wickerhamomyces pijperi]|uniref:Uncharacterized protein n=1 Tax=Wickerhamomyces pijperi TaxID=599730 RepID=A0A9P8TKL2_WICPI|nr:hypothetical protein WICPIJ_007265 [Wickerhamomyces pijperi]
MRRDMADIEGNLMILKDFGFKSCWPLIEYVLMVGGIGKQQVFISNTFIAAVSGRDKVMEHGLVLEQWVIVKDFNDGQFLMVKTIGSLVCIISVSCSSSSSKYSLLPPEEDEDEDSDEPASLLEVSLAVSDSFSDDSKLTSSWASKAEILAVFSLTRASISEIKGAVIVSVLHCSSGNISITSCLTLSKIISSITWSLGMLN